VSYLWRQCSIITFFFKTSNNFKIEKNISFYLQIANSLHNSSTVFICKLQTPFTIQVLFLSANCKLPSQFKYCFYLQIANSLHNSSTVLSANCKLPSQFKYCFYLQIANSLHNSSTVFTMQRNACYSINYTKCLIVKFVLMIFVMWLVNGFWTVNWKK
jgi:uncharacterized protein YueI